MQQAFAQLPHIVSQPLVANVDPHVKQIDPFENMMLTSGLASDKADGFAKHCKSLRSVQKFPGYKTPVAARAGGMVCAKFLLQNFLDPNCAGGCGVAPFPSRIRFRLRAVVSVAGRC